MSFWLSTEKILEVLKKSKIKFYKEGEVKKGLKYPYAVYRDEKILVHNWLEIKKCWQEKMNIKYFGDYDRQSPDPELGINPLIRTLNQTRLKKWVIDNVEIYYQGLMWKQQNGMANKEKDRITEINIVFEMKSAFKFIEVPTPEEEKKILDEDKKLKEEIKEMKNEKD